MALSHTQTLPEEFNCVTNKSVNVFCPRVQLKQLINEVGTPNLETEVKDDGTIEIKDTNTTYDKIKEQLPTFIEKYAGKDLKEIVEREADNVMMKMLKSEKKHSDDEALKSFSYKIKKKQNLKLTIKRFSTPPALPWNGWHSDIEFTNSLYHR